MIIRGQTRPLWMAMALLAVGCADQASDDQAVLTQADGSDEEVQTAEQLFPPASTPTTPTTPGATPARTCSGRGTWRTGDTNVTLTVGGERRTYILHVPASYRGDQPVPLLVDMHPLFGTSGGQRNNSGYAAIADRQGFIVAYPQGLRGGIANAWNIGICCSAGKDEQFIRALVDKIKSEGCIDDKRVYAAGYSMGGGMSHYLACNAADVFAATAPAAFDLLIEREMPCKPSRPVSVIMFRGTNDPIVPYAGGFSRPPNGFTPSINFEGAVNSFKRWARINECTGSPVAAGAGCQSYTECKGGVEVTLCTKQGGGHDYGVATYGWEHMSKYTMP